jgi:hypothetical protein
MTATAASSGSLAAAGERRIARLTLLFGAAAAIAAAPFDLRWSAGVATGAALAWVNMRWLGQALDALVRISVAQSEAARPRMPRRLQFKFFARYALIGIVTYVIFARFGVPVGSVICGLLALGAATIANGVFELFRSK